MSKPGLVYYDCLNFGPNAMNLLKEQFDVVCLADPSADASDVLAGCSVLFAPKTHPVDKDKIDACPNLAVIASPALNADHVDVAYATDKGISVVHLGGETQLMHSITSTAELTWGMIINLVRKMPWAVRDAQAGNWRGRHWGENSGGMLSRMKLGVIGLGRLGRIVAGYGLAFGMEVAAYSPSSTMDGIKTVHSLNELAKWADIVSMHAAITPKNRQMVGTDFFQAMKPGAYFVNTARGELVDETALLSALESGHLGGAALDVLSGMLDPDFANTVDDHPLIKYARENDNLLLTPYYAGATRDAWEATQIRIAELAIQQIG